MTLQADPSARASAVVRIPAIRSRCRASERTTYLRYDADGHAETCPTRARRTRVMMGSGLLVATYAPLELALSNRPSLGGCDLTYSLTPTPRIRRMPHRCSI